MIIVVLARKNMLAFQTNFAFDKMISKKLLTVMRQKNTYNSIIFMPFNQ